MRGDHIYVYLAVLAHDKGKRRLRVTAVGSVEKAVQLILCAENCPKQAIVSMTRIMRNGRKVKIKLW